MSRSISFLLVEPENPDNIGAACRAMKNMGLNDLRLVKPPSDWKRKARTLAVGAAGMLDSVSVYEDMETAVADAALIVGTSRRYGGRRRLFVPFDRVLEEIRKTAQTKRVIVVFGKESRGLANEHLKACDRVTALPTADEFPSINLAQAVMLMAYSLLEQDCRRTRATEHEFLSRAEVSDAIRHFTAAVSALGYKPVLVNRIRATFHGILKRSSLVSSEAKMIKGISRRILQRTKKDL